MKYSREYIIGKAFDVFMNRGYDSTSISVLQQELQMSRGAMYRYFKNKEELFICVIDECFFKPFDKMVGSVTQERDKKVSELIEISSRRQRLIVAAFARIGITHSVFLNYTALIIQAAKHYPNFVCRFKKIQNDLRTTWKFALRNSIEAGEIRKDANIDILAGLFMSVSANEGSDQDIDEEMFSEYVIRDFYKRIEIMEYLFNLIKI